MDKREEATPALSKDNIASAKHIYEGLMVVVIAGCRDLGDLYLHLRVGGGFFKGRRMAQLTENTTSLETVAYIGALGTLLMEHWPNRPEDMPIIINILETTMFDAQQFNMRPQYEMYRQSFFKYLAPTDLHNPSWDIIKQLRINDVHHMFVMRIADLWSYQASIERFVNGMNKITKQVESLVRQVLSNELPYSRHA